MEPTRVNMKCTGNHLKRGKLTVSHLFKIHRFFFHQFDYASFNFDNNNALTVGFISWHAKKNLNKYRKLML